MIVSCFTVLSTVSCFTVLSTESEFKRSQPRHSKTKLLVLNRRGQVEIRDFDNK